MDAELDESSVDDVNQCEDKIVYQSRAALHASSREIVQHKLDELDEILNGFGLQTRLLVVERANSLAVYFICMTLSALTSLRDQWRCRQLRDIVQSLFTFLLQVARTVRIKRLLWPLRDYQRCLEFFSFVDGKQALI